MAWTRASRISEALLDLAADRGWDDDVAVNATVLELAQRHGLVSALADHVDDPIVRAMSAREKIRSRTLAAHLPRLMTSLRDAGVRAAVVKGPSLSRFYATPHIRTFSDLDLLVPRRETQRAIEVLAKDEAVVEVPPKRPTLDKRDLLFRDGSGVTFNVDLHWSLFSYSQLRGASNSATEDAWEQAVEVQGPHYSQWELPLPHRLAFLCAHAILDHRFRLILFRDLAELDRSVGIPWDSLIETAQRYGLRSTTYVPLWITKHALGASFPDEALTEIRPRSVPIAFLERTLPRTDLVRFDGHRVHPINLAAVLLNDSPRTRATLMMRSPRALPGWLRRTHAPGLRSGTSPRTLVLVTNDRRRGAEVNAERLRDGLVRRGWVVEVVALYDTGASPRVRVETLIDSKGREARRFEIRTLLALGRRVRSFRSDIVVANGGPTLRYAVAVKPFASFRLVYVGIGDPGYWVRSKASRIIYRFLLRRCDHVVAVSDATRLQLLSLEPSLNDKTTTVWNGAPSSLLATPRQPDPGPLRLLVVGSLTDEKNPLLALRTAAAMDASIRFVGSGPLGPVVAREAAALGVGERVELVGSVSSVEEHLRWAHLLLLTSRTEGLPGAVLEAAAAGVPTVALDVGGVGEAVMDGVSGVVVPHEADLAPALAALDADRDRIERMSVAARELARSRFTVDQTVERYRSLLLDIWAASSSSN